LRHTSSYFPRVGAIPQPLKSGPDHARGPITCKPSLRKVLDVERVPGS